MRPDLRVAALADLGAASEIRGINVYGKQRVDGGPHCGGPIRWQRLATDSHTVAILLHCQGITWREGHERGTCQVWPWRTRAPTEHRKRPLWPQQLGREPGRPLLQETMTEIRYVPPKEFESQEFAGMRLTCALTWAKDSGPPAWNRAKKQVACAREILARNKVELVVYPTDGIYRAGYTLTRRA